MMSARTGAWKGATIERRLSLIVNFHWFGTPSCLNIACELWCASVLLQVIFVPLLMHVVQRKLCVVERLSLTWMPIGFEVFRASPSAGSPLVRKEPFSVIDPLALTLVVRLNLTCVRLIDASLGSQTLPIPSLSRSAWSGL